MRGSGGVRLGPPAEVGGQLERWRTPWAAAGSCPHMPPLQLFHWELEAQTPSWEPQIVSRDAKLGLQCPLHPRISGPQVTEPEPLKGLAASAWPEAVPRQTGKQLWVSQPAVAGRRCDQAFLLLPRACEAGREPLPGGVRQHVPSATPTVTQPPQTAPDTVCWQSCGGGAGGLAQRWACMCLSVQEPGLSVLRPGDSLH